MKKARGTRSIKQKKKAKSENFVSHNNPVTARKIVSDSENLGNDERGECSTSTPTNQIFDEEEERRQPRMRSLQDLYESTNELHLVCLLADAESIIFEEAVRDKKWQAAMDEEIA
eukprot:c18273_g1_i1 orf=116-460(+)